MRVLVVYDSMYGNTARVAGAIAEALRASDEVRLLPVAEATPAALAEVRLLVVGSPTQRFRPMPAVARLVRSLPANSLDGVRVAAFDTRLAIADVHNAVLSFFVRILGASAFAARHIERALTRAGGRPAAASEGFLVDGTEGPLRPGELERAARWALLAAASARGAAGGAEQAPRVAPPPRAHPQT